VLNESTDNLTHKRLIYLIVFILYLLNHQNLSSIKSTEFSHEWLVLHIQPFGLLFSHFARMALQTVDQMQY